MNRVALAVLLYLAPWVWRPEGAGAQNHPERAAIFVVGDQADDLVQQTLSDVRAELTAAGMSEVRPDIAKPPSLVSPDLEQAQRAGLEAFNRLAEGVAPHEVKAAYGPVITEALRQVSEVPDAEGRALLWNLCALRVHLELLAETEEMTREAVLDCSRRFPDRPSLGAWHEDVVRTFERFDAHAHLVAVAVKTAPAGCDLRVYGAPVGVTPLVVEVAPGPQEFQLECSGKRGPVHRLEVHRARSLTLRQSADDAYELRQGTPALRYVTEQDSARVLNDAHALAEEAEADSFVVVEAQRDGVAVQWVRAPAKLLRRELVARSMAPLQRRGTVARIFAAKPVSEEAEVRFSTTSRRRSAADYWLGGGLLVLGAGLAVYPSLALAWDGRCVDATCEEVYAARSWKASLLFGASGALMVAGAAVLWVGPFGKRYKVSIANGLAVQGSF